MSDQKDELTVWLLSDGTPGHLSQSRGLVDALARFRQLRCIEVPLTLRRKWLKRLLRPCLPLSPALSRAVLPWVYRLEQPTIRPDLIISSGGNTLLASALLARLWSVPNIYSGTRKGYPPAAFSCVVSVTPQGGPGNLVLPLPPVPSALLHSLPPAQEPAPLCLLIGGEGAGYHYRETDWLALCDGINALSVHSGRRWCISTSRRTGAKVESLLEQHLKSEHIEEIVYFSRSPRPVVRDFGSRSALVFVTEDSLTMVAEAMYSSRPVFSLQPKHFSGNPNDEGALQAYVKQRLLKRVPLTRLSTLALPEWPTAVPLPDVQALIYAHIRHLVEKPQR